MSKSLLRLRGTAGTLPRSISVNQQLVLLSCLVQLFSSLLESGAVRAVCRGVWSGHKTGGIHHL